MLKMSKSILKLIRGIIGWPILIVVSIIPSSIVTLFLFIGVAGLVLFADVFGKLIDSFICWKPKYRAIMNWAKKQEQVDDSESKVEPVDAIRTLIEKAEKYNKDGDCGCGQKK